MGAYRDLKAATVRDRVNLDGGFSETLDEAWVVGAGAGSTATTSSSRATFWNGANFPDATGKLTVGLSEPALGGDGTHYGATGPQRTGSSTNLPLLLAPKGNGALTMLQLTGLGVYSINLVPGHSGGAIWAHGAYAVAIGFDASAGEAATPGTAQVAVGHYARATATQGVALGGAALASGVGTGGSVAVGYGADATDAGVAIGSGALAAASGIAIGAAASAQADSAMAFGNSVIDAAATGAVALGNGNSIGAAAEGSYVLGQGMTVDTPGVTVFGVPAAASASADHGGQVSGAHAPDVTFYTDVADLEATGTHSVNLPGGTTFYVTEVGLVITTASGVTGQPEVRFGNGAGDDDSLVAQVATVANAARERDRYTTLLTSDGQVSQLRATVNVAGAAVGGFTGRFYFKGSLLIDE